MKMNNLYGQFILPAFFFSLSDASHLTGQLEQQRRQLQAERQALGSGRRGPSAMVQLTLSLSLCLSVSPSLSLCL